MVTRSLKFLPATETYFMERIGAERPFLYRRNAPADIAKVIGKNVWWIRLDRDKATAMRRAEALRRQHDDFIVRLRSAQVQALLKAEGGGVAVREALVALRLDQIVGKEAEAQPNRLAHWLAPGRVRC